MWAPEFRGTHVIHTFVATTLDAGTDAGIPLRLMLTIVPFRAATGAAGN